MIALYRTLVVITLLLPVPALAQQPGTPQYNSVYLPAHGVGDTARTSVNRWGLGREEMIGNWAGLSQAEQKRKRVNSR